MSRHHIINIYPIYQPSANFAQLIRLVLPKTDKSIQKSSKVNVLNVIPTSSASTAGFSAGGAGDTDGSPAGCAGAGEAGDTGADMAHEVRLRTHPACAAENTWAGKGMDVFGLAWNLNILMWSVGVIIENLSDMGI